MIITTLSNGIQAVLEKVPFFHSVSVGVWVKAGSRYETPEENGISHFIEHMLFKGTKTKSAQQIAAEIDNIGGTLNAFTAKECTCYYVHIIDEHLKIGIDLLADMLINSKFDAQEIKKEQGVVCEEISMVEDTPDDLVHEIAAKGFYGSNSLGQAILGTKERVQSFDRDAIASYMQKRYVSGNIVISIAGNIEEDQALALLEAAFSSGVTIGDKTNDALDSEAHGSNNVVSVVKSNEQINMCLTFAGVGNESAGFYPLTVFNGVFGGSMSSRLFQTIRERNGLTYSIFSYPSAYNDCGTYSIYAGMNPSQTQRVLELVGQEIRRAMEQNMTQQELQNAREQIKGSLILGTEGARPIMSRNGKMLLLKGRTEPVENIITRLNNVTLEDIHAVVKKVFEGPVCGAFVGKQDAIPKEIHF